uniref:Uncharacterized protein n=1 Tax=Anopheles stephensi TaxID=30069 RepID=A0A182YLY6_ANOST
MLHETTTLGRWAAVCLILVLHSVRANGANVVLDELQTKDFNDNECGKRLAQREGLVKGGYLTRPGDWPWHVALYQRGINSDGFEYACGGSIVHRYLVLTAAHCGNCGRNEHIYEFEEKRKPIFKQYPWMVTVRHPFQDSEYVPCNGVLLNRNYILTTTCVDWQDEVSVTLGDYDTGKTKDCGTIDGSEQCVSSVQTVSVGQVFRKDELVLARLTIPAVIGRRDHIEAICLPVTPQQRDRLYNRYIMTGWKESGSDSKILQRAVLDAVDLNQCRAELQSEGYHAEASQKLDDSIICARNLNNASRSPQCNDYQPGSAIQAIEKKSNRYLLYGLQTGISYCTVPERYIAISKYLQWILDNIRG